MTPRFIVCRRCQTVAVVRKPSEQRRRRYCSRRCANLAHACNIPREAMARGGKMRAHRARERIRQRVETLSPLEAFRYGYKLGLQSKTRQLQGRRCRIAA